MDLGIAGKVALVTAGSKGIGRGIAEALAAEGVRVALTSRSAETAQAVASEIAAARGAGGGASEPGTAHDDAGAARGYGFDSDDLDAIDALLTAVQADLGPIDIYVANTGGPPAGDPLSFTREQWERAQRTLLISPLTIVERLLPAMRERGFGRIVAVGSSSVREPIDAIQLSNAHRPGLVAAFKVLARRVAAEGVTLNHVHPGQILTDRIIDVAGSLEAAEERARQNIPAGRLGTVAELAAAAVFLCSRQAGYINGTAIVVDGALGRSV